MPKGHTGYHFKMQKIASVVPSDKFGARFVKVIFECGHSHDGFQAYSNRAGSRRKCDECTRIMFPQEVKWSKSAAIRRMKANTKLAEVLKIELRLQHFIDEAVAQKPDHDLNY